MNPQGLQQVFACIRANHADSDEQGSTLATHKSMIIGQRLRQRVLMAGFTVLAGSGINRDSILTSDRPITYTHPRQYAMLQ